MKIFLTKIQTPNFAFFVRHRTPKSATAKTIFVSLCQSGTPASMHFFDHLYASFCNRLFVRRAHVRAFHRGSIYLRNIQHHLLFNLSLRKYYNFVNDQVITCFLEPHFFPGPQRLAVFLASHFCGPLFSGPGRVS